MLIVSWMRSDRAPATSTPVGPPPTITKFRAPWSISVGSRSASSKTPRMRERSRCASSRRVEREGVVVGAGGAEEVGLRPGGEDERVAGEDLPVGGGHAVRRRIERGDLGELDVHVDVIVEELAQRVGDVARGQLRGRHLVEQRLELVVVVAVDQRDAHVVAVGQAAGAADAGEAAADDDDVQLPLGQVNRHAPAPMRPAERPGARGGGRRRAPRWPSRSAPG